MRPLSPTELDSLRRLKLLHLYNNHFAVFDFLESKSREELIKSGIAQPTDDDVLGLLKVKFEHNKRFNAELRKHLHISPGFYANYAEMLARFVIAKNGLKAYGTP